MWKKNAVFQSIFVLFFFPWCRGLFFAHNHVSSAGCVTFLSVDLFWKVQPGTRHWAA